MWGVSAERATIRGALDQPMSTNQTSWQSFEDIKKAAEAGDPASQCYIGICYQTGQGVPLDFPEFNAIDSLDNWSILRLGMRNRLQTRRDSQTLNWLELDPDCDVPLALEPMPFEGDAMISSSFAFGGLNAVLAAKRV